MIILQVELTTVIFSHHCLYARYKTKIVVEKAYGSFFGNEKDMNKELGSVPCHGTNTPTSILYKTILSGSI